MPSPAGRPPLLVLAAAVLLIEAVVAFVFGVVEIGQIRTNRAVVGIGVTVIMLGLAVALLLVGRGVLRARRWSQAPAAAIQLILLPTAWNFRDPPTTWVAVVLGLVALSALVGLLHPRSSRAFIASTQPRPEVQGPG